MKVSEAGLDIPLCRMAPDIWQMLLYAGVTADMLDWYMAWRGLDPLRFVIANPENNMSAMSMQTSKFADEDLIGAEKYWDTTQMVIKMSDMGPAKEAVNFKCPSDVGFDMEVLKSSNTASLICARGYAHGQPPAAGPDYLICHQVIEKRMVWKCVPNAGLAGL